MQNRRSVIVASPTSLIILVAAALKFALHLYTAPGYGFFGDALYTMALSRHLALGYVDLPPLVPALVALSRSLLGESLFAMSIFPALAGAFTLVFVCLIAKELGGKAFAVGLSALVFIFLPVWLMLNASFCYDGIDQLVLAGFLFALVRFLKSGNRKLWLVMGAVAGIACITKLTLPFLLPGFFLALLISKHRRDLLSPWPWLGGALCLAILSPYVFWQIANHWPTLEYWKVYSATRLYESSLPQYLTNVLMFMNPLLLPLWFIGLYRLFRRFQGVSYGFLGILFLATLTVGFLAHAPTRMMVELFIPLVAAGAVFLEEKLSGAGWRKAAKAVVSTYALAAGLSIVPVVLPVLPVQFAAKYTSRAKPLLEKVRESNWNTEEYSIALTGRLGWDKMVQTVADVYNGLPPEERAVAGIYAEWYSGAGAIDVLGSYYGLPRAVSGHLTNYLWGPGDYSWDVMIVVTGSAGNKMAAFFEECKLEARVPSTSNPHMAGNDHIYICRKPKIPPAEIWIHVKNYR
jgi:4-amino-4-deoxy-L-arabinose transferase-like glycosyltransferase